MSMFLNFLSSSLMILCSLFKCFLYNLILFGEAWEPINGVGSYSCMLQPKSQRLD